MSEQAPGLMKNNVCGPRLMEADSIGNQVIRCKKNSAVNNRKGNGGDYDVAFAVSPMEGEL